MQIVGQAVPKRLVNEALDNRFILRAGKGLVLSATDFNVYVDFALQEGAATIEHPGELLLPLDKVVQLLREGRDDRIRIEEIAENRCRLMFTDGYFDLPTADPAAFPSRPVVKTKAIGAARVETFVEGLDRGKVARAAEEGRYLFDHILLELEGDGFTVVTTDGRRMAAYAGALQKPLAGKERVLLAPAALSQARKLCERSTGLVRISCDHAKVEFETDRGTVIATVRDDAAFPDFRPHLDGRPRSRRAAVSRGLLLSATRRIALLTTEHLRAVEFRLHPGELILACRSGITGEGELRVPIEYEGAAEEVFFDPTYVAEGLAAMGAETIEIRFENAEEGAIFHDGEAFRYLVMPILIDARESTPS
ncbi:MAG: hypothetical protein HY720_30775 [Planctomycetes bacterium]|nr:hypothetical protein [Planctomycetota bacterium]